MTATYQRHGSGRGVSAGRAEALPPTSTGLQTTPLACPSAATGRHGDSPSSDPGKTLPSSARLARTPGDRCIGYALHVPPIP